MAEKRIHNKGEVTFSEILEEFEGRIGKEVGAIGSFIGTVRDAGLKDGEKVEKLDFECADTVGEELKTIEEEVKNQTEGISEIEIHHFIDELKPGEEIIYVLVGGKHREEVFDTLPTVMDRVKSEVRIWKKEFTEEDNYWTHEIERE